MTLIESLDIEVDVVKTAAFQSSADRLPIYHVHAYAPAGKQFSVTEIHNLCLWDDVKSPNWKAILSDLQKELPLIDCTDPDCDYCAGE